MTDALLGLPSTSPAPAIDASQRGGPGASRTAYLGHDHFVAKADVDLSMQSDSTDECSEDVNEELELIRLNSCSVIVNLASSILDGWNVLDDHAVKSLHLTNKSDSKTSLNTPVKIENLQLWAKEACFDLARRKFIGTLVAKKLLPKDTMTRFPQTTGKTILIEGIILDWDDTLFATSYLKKLNQTDRTLDVLPITLRLELLKLENAAVIAL
jgi:hypothetical protein